MSPYSADYRTTLRVFWILMKMIALDDIFKRKTAETYPQTFLKTFMLH